MGGFIYITPKSLLFTYFTSQLHYLYGELMISLNILVVVDVVACKLVGSTNVLTCELM